MAASNCIPAFHPAVGRIDARPPPSARAHYPDFLIPTSAPIRSFPTCVRGGARRSVRWNSVWGIREFLQQKRASRFGVRASTADRQGDSGGPSRGDSTPSVGLVQAPRNAADIVQEFYERINRRDYIGVANLFTEDCEYEDFNYSETTRGRQEVLKFFEKVMSSFGTELKFVIDDITRDDPNAVGVIWHLDWRGKAFPFSRGCSFYRCAVSSDGQRQIRFARDIVEPATKPGGVAMGALWLVTSLFERFPQIADRL